MATIGIDDKEFKKGMDDAEKTTEKSTKSIKSQVMTLAQTYKKQGMTMSDAMKKANEEIRKSSESSTDKIKNKFKSIGESVSKVGNVVKKASIPFIALGTAAIKVGSDFNAGMSEVGAITGATVSSNIQAAVHVLWQSGEQWCKHTMLSCLPWQEVP